MLTAEKIQSNWDEFLGYISTHISSPRKEALIQFYTDREERFVLMPASYKPQYHSCFPGGYIDHVNRVIKSSLLSYDMWEKMGADMTTFTKEELVFAAINHDLGKFGSDEEACYIEQTDTWRKDKLGEQYTFNTKIEFMSVPDRSLYLLMENNIPFSKNEMLAIKLHDGIYDEANKPYLVSWTPEQKPRSSIVYILHHADMMATRIEFETEWLPKFKNGENTKSKMSTTISTSTSNPIAKVRKTKEEIKTKALSSLIDNNNVLNNFFKQ